MGTNPVGLQPGDSATLRDLMYAALMQSDNVAAVTLAWHVGKTLPASGADVSPVDRFVAQMNALARKLGMTRTLFLNPHGLDSAETKLPYSTAADLARLSRYAMDRAAFRFFVSQKERRISINHVAGGLAAFSLVNTNELLGYNGVDGVKTGRTRLAGDCVIISAAKAPDSRKEGENFIVTPRRLLVVVLGADQRFSAATQLLESGWRLHAAWEAAGRPIKKKETL
jgi:D-alanyl-D-alanine carboxypeptidase (penicillin-binding protein 5/6)